MCDMHVSTNAYVCKCMRIARCLQPQPFCAVLACFHDSQMQGFGANGELQYEREGEVATTLLSLLKSKSPHFCAAIAKQEFTYTPLPGEELAAMTDNKEAEQTVSYEVEFKEVSPGGKRAQVGQSSAEKKQGRYVCMCICMYVCMYYMETSSCMYCGKDLWKVYTAL